jgi:hypothetical protein
VFLTCAVTKKHPSRRASVHLDVSRALLIRAQLLDGPSLMPHATSDGPGPVERTRHLAAHGSRAGAPRPTGRARLAWLVGALATQRGGGGRAVSAGARAPGGPDNGRRFFADVAFDDRRGRQRRARAAPRGPFARTRESGGRAGAAGLASVGRLHVRRVPDSACGRQRSLERSMPRPFTTGQTRQLAAARKTRSGRRPRKPRPCPKCGAVCDSYRRATGHC